MKPRIFQNNISRNIVMYCKPIELSQTPIIVGTVQAIHTCCSAVLLLVGRLVRVNVDLTALVVDS
jgi:hypothetical protein